jgi:[ribosomal protein S18]-alanine N-acetyltransferase
MDECDDVTICPMTEDDLDQVLGIESASFSHPWNRTHFHDELKSPHSFPFSAFDGTGRLVGYICPMIILDEGHILDVAVHPDFRGHGLGKLLVEKVLAICRERDAEFVSLEVRPSNIEAISLYHRLGFIETGKRPRYYHDGEDAILMEYIFTEKEEGSDAV